MVVLPVISGEERQFYVFKGGGVLVFVDCCLERLLWKRRKNFNNDSLSALNYCTANIKIKMKRKQSNGSIMENTVVGET